jgi:methylmalonyl-CoA mutase C-terminal domain/subunit
VVALLADAGREDVLLVVGGIIPEDDIVALESAGVARVFTPGASLAEIGSWLESALDSREHAS